MNYELNIFGKPRTNQSSVLLTSDQSELRDQLVRVPKYMFNISAILSGSTSPSSAVYLTP